MVLERFLEERPFNMYDEDRIEEMPEMLDDRDRKNSLLVQRTVSKEKFHLAPLPDSEKGSPPPHYKDRNRNRMPPRESPSLCEPLPDRIGPQGPTPPPNFGPRHSPGAGPGLGPPGSAMSPPQNLPPPGAPPSAMPPLQRQFGFQPLPEASGMSGPMGMRPQLPALRQMAPVVSGPLPAATGPAPPMLLAGRGIPSAQFGPRLPAMRPPANMVPPPQNALPPPGMSFAGPRPLGPPGSNPQLDNLASMLVQAAKQQGKKPDEETEPTSMLKAAGADDSDLEEEADSLDAMVHRMRKDAEEQQRQRSLQVGQGPQGFQAMARPAMPLPSDGPHPHPHGPHGPQGPLGPHPLPHGPNGPHPYGPHGPLPHSHGPQPFPPRAPGYSPQLAGPPPAFVAPPEEQAAQQLYLRIAKQTANGMQEQLAREQKAEAAETPASPPPLEVEMEARAWKLISLDVPLKTPYPLMQLPHDLPYSRADPRLTGQLRLVGGAKPESQPHDPQPQTHPHPQPQPQEPHSHHHQQQQQLQQQTPPPQPSIQPPSAADVGGRAYTPSLPAAPKDPRLGRAVPEVPAALLQKPLAALPLDLEPPDRPPPKMQLSERSSSFQAAAPAQPESRAYLLDPRFRRRKASLPSTATPDNPEEPKKDSTPVPSSGESSPVE